MLPGISLNTNGLELQQQQDTSIIWRDGYGELASLNTFAKTPDIPVSIDDINGLRGHYRQQAGVVNAAIVEVSVVEAAKRAVVWVVVRQRPRGGGDVYLGSLLVPFASASIVLRSQATEPGTPSEREQQVLESLIDAGKLVIQNGVPQGFYRDPYLPQHRATILASQADDSRLDAVFPHSGPSRVRRQLHAWCQSLSIDGQWATLPGFKGPKRWW
jgi:hypothetical protein